MWEWIRSNGPNNMGTVRTASSVWIVLAVAIISSNVGASLVDIIQAEAPDLLQHLSCDGSNSIDCIDYVLGNSITNEDIATEWLDYLNVISIETAYMGGIANWNFLTNMTDYNAKITKEMSLTTGDISLQMKNQGRRFNTDSFDYSKKRLFKLLLRGGVLTDRNKREELSKVANTMQAIYGKGAVCQADKKCLTLEPDLENIMATSRDYDKLLWAWKGWRDEVGRKNRPLYPQYVQLKNEAAQASGYPDHSAVLQEKYELPKDEFEEMIYGIYLDVKPMYDQLHAYVRRKLIQRYGREKVDIDGAIPAHLLGNMWAQQWNNIYDLVIPFPNVTDVNVTKEMGNQGYTVNDMFKVAERFFTSIGMDPMPESFWNNSMLEKPIDRDVICHGSAHNLFKHGEVRIKMCTAITMEDLYTVHHEMGHCEYYLQYHDQPLVFSSGANPGFHEAVGDTIALSVVTPDYLKKIGLLDEVVNSKESDINFLMKVALSKIAFLPFGLMIDKWRWDVFRGIITPDSYNEAWWKLRREYQGIAPPIDRTEDDFDPGAKYHIPSGTPYIRYFISFVIQFQFHQAMCEASGHTGPLHLCNNYNSPAAGRKLSEMLKLGISKPWWEALYQLTGRYYIDPSAIQEYFAPLIRWLEEQNGDDVGWEL